MWAARRGFGLVRSTSFLSGPYAPNPSSSSPPSSLSFAVPFPLLYGRMMVLSWTTVLAVVASLGIALCVLVGTSCYLLFMRGSHCWCPPPSARTPGSVALSDGRSADGGSL